MCCTRLPIGKMQLLLTYLACFSRPTSRYSHIIPLQQTSHPETVNPTTKETIRTNHIQWLRRDDTRTVSMYVGKYWSVGGETLCSYKDPCCHHSSFSDYNCQSPTQLPRRLTNTKPTQEYAA
jgi:hypothetical protein